MKLIDHHLSFDTDEQTFIIAELSANHNQSLDLAKKTIVAMKEAGADAVKLQTYTADTITLDCDNEFFQIEKGSLWEGETLYSLYKKAYTPWEWHKELQELAHQLGLAFLSSPFDFSSVDFLEELNVPAYKIASPEITDIPLIKYVAQKQKPVIISTGIATRADIEEAIEACHDCGNSQIVLLLCTTAYPTPFEQVNLVKLPVMKELFQMEVGVSDHTPGNTVPIASIPLGGKVIEKHFILDRNVGGPDAAFSMNASEFKQMVNGVREAELAIGQVEFNNSGQENLSGQRRSGRSLFAVDDINDGDEFTKENIRSIRPGNGLHTRHYYALLGKKAKGPIKKGTPLNWDLIS